jgi:hypothetical protein
VTLFAAVEGHDWFVSVHDDGRGISADAVPKLGTRYHHRWCGPKPAAG